MVRTLLICGLLAGVLAGVLAFGFESAAGEPALEEAIAYEEATAAASGGAPPGPVSRQTQKGVGLLSASVVYGLALGGLFALVFALAYGRAVRLSPARTAVVLAATAFVVLYLVPFLKYPPAPPAVGDPDTLGQRTALHFTMVAISVCAAIAAWRLGRALRAHRSADAATLLGLASYVAVVGVAGLALPAVDEIPRSFPPTTLYEFRLASLGTQIVVWSAIGLVFAGLAQRVMSGRGLPSLRRATKGRVS